MTDIAEWTEGVCDDGAAILRDGVMVPITELLATLNRYEEALAFYASPEIYKPHPHGIAFDRPDLSWRARAALRHSVANAPRK